MATTGPRKLVERVRAFAGRHPKVENELETGAQAVGLNLLWGFLRRAGIFGAGVAAAAVTSTLLSTSPQQLSPATLPGFVARDAPRYHLDAAAAVSVSSREGLGGGIGDFGTSFGPWQMHYGGALPASVYQGPYSSATQAWAWSQTGVDYALRHIAAVCAGLRGYAAVACIVSRFERPLHPAPEIAGAWSAYPHYTSINQPPPPPRPLTRAQRLRLKTGFFAWYEWLHGVSRWNRYPPHDQHVRPHIPARVPGWYWARNRTMQNNARRDHV